MRVIRVFPRRTSYTPSDPLSFVGDPPLFIPPADEVHISVTFTWDLPEATRLYHAWQAVHPNVQIGGPALNTPADAFTPGLYVRPGITFTTRGCNNKCPWCLIPQREGKLVELDITPGHIVQDNNLLQASPRHIDKVFDMLKSQRNITFAGGLDARLITPYIAQRIQQLHIRQVFLAADTWNAIAPLQRAIQMLQLPRRKLRTYALIGFNGETIQEARQRLQAIWNAGALPFAQLYQPPDHHITYPQEWRDLARAWSRPAITFTIQKEGVTNP